jgi:two-component system, sensor histidine kinase PdtaS
MAATTNNTLTKDIEQFIENQRYQLVIKLSFVICFAFLVLSISFLSETLGSFLTMVSGVVITIVGLIYTFITKKYKITLVLYSFCGVVISGIALLEMHTATHYGEMLWMTAGIMLGFLGLGNKYGWSLVFLAIVFILLFIWTELNNNLVSVPQRNDFQKFAVSAELVIALSSVAYIFTVFIKFHNFSQSQLLLANENLENKNSTISAQDEEKTILVKEIHHRVKNNLQIISSLLRLQGNDIENEELKKHFDEATNRIIVMSMIHQRLYDGKELSKIQLVQYLKELSNDLERIYAHEHPIHFDIDSNLNTIGLKSIVPIGLIFNELISNSLKYAFMETQGGTITIKINELNDGKINILYSDNGNWKGDEVTKNGFGLELIDLLTEQLDGIVTLTLNTNLTQYEFEFPNLSN